MDLTHVADQRYSRHLRLSSRILEKVYRNVGETNCFDFTFYTVKVQVRLFGLWITVWAETCEYTDGDSRPYIRNCAEEVLQALTDKI